MKIFQICFIAALCSVASTVMAQSTAVDVHFGTAGWGRMHFNTATRELEPLPDRGFGGRISHGVLPILNVEADVTIYPGFANEPRGRSAGTLGDRRLEGLFGITVGPILRRARPFFKTTAGFVDVSPNQALECGGVRCVIANGGVVPAYELGGGVEISATRRVFLRFDIAERILKYPEHRSDFESVDAAFVHALRITGGIGMRF